MGWGTRLLPIKPLLNGEIENIEISAAIGGQLHEGVIFMYDLYDEIANLQREYSKKNNHRLEISISSDMDIWTCEMAMEAWAARLSKGVGINPIQAFEKAKKRLKI